MTFLFLSLAYFAYDSDLHFHPLLANDVISLFLLADEMPLCIHIFFNTLSVGGQDSVPCYCDHWSDNHGCSGVSVVCMPIFLHILTEDCDTFPRLKSKMSLWKENADLGEHYSTNFCVLKRTMDIIHAVFSIWCSLFQVLGYIFVPLILSVNLWDTVILPCNLFR